MELHEPRVHTINILKYLTWPESSHFGLRPTRKREREREREREKIGSQASLFDSRDFVGHSSIVQELKLLYETRATCGYRNHKILSRFKVQVFIKTENRRCPGKSRYLRYGFSPTQVNFCLRACVCPREMLSSFSLRPYDCILAITWPSLIRIE